MYNKISLPVCIVVLALMSSVGMAKDKVLFVDSYHEGYAWSDGITKGIETVLDGKVDLKVVHMDTKRNPSDEFKAEAAKKVIETIKDWKPDVVIVSDDNAAKFVVKDYHEEIDTPFIFCGVNWDASGYGFPADNVCGMLEVSLIPQLLEQLSEFGKTDKIGFLGPDITTAHKEADAIAKKFNLNLETYFSKDFDDWKTGYTKLQDSCDAVIVDSDGGLYTADHADEMKKFVVDNSKKPTGACYDFLAPYVLLSFAKVAEEQGEWAGAAALEILGGKTPTQIGVVENKRGAVFINMNVVKKLGADVPMELIETATVVVD